MVRLKRYKEGVWFNVPGLDGVRVKVRPIYHSQVTRIMNKHRKKVVVEITTEEAGVLKEKREKEFKVVDDYDEAAIAFDLFNYTLEDFEGIDAEGDVKTAIFDCDPLREFISEKAGELKKKYEEEFEEDLKNSESSQGG